MTEVKMTIVEPEMLIIYQYVCVYNVCDYRRPNRETDKGAANAVLAK